MINDCHRGGIHQGISLNRYGKLVVRSISTSTKEVVDIPAGFSTAEGSASFSIGAGLPIVRYKSERGEILLDTKHFRIGQEGPFTYSKQNIGRLVKALKKDKYLQAAAISLRHGIFQSFFGHVASTNATISKRVANLLLKASNSQMSYSQAPSQPEEECTTERIVETVDQEVEGWINTTITAADQAAACGLACLERPAWEILGCELGCASRAFEDIIISTWGVIDTITREVVHEITHCIEVSEGTIPTPLGPMTINTELIATQMGIFTTPPGGDQAEALTQAMRCVLTGDWKIKNLGDLEIRIAGIEAIPIALTVCMDRDCAIRLRDILGTLGLSATWPLLLAGFDAVKWVKAAGLWSALEALAVALGLTALQVLGILIAVLVFMSYHSLAIAGQIVVLDALNAIEEGVCLNHPTFPILASAVINPILALQLAIHVPVIVTPRKDI